MTEKKHHVTIVDDLNENLEHYENFLEEDFSLQTFSDPESALDWLKENKTNLLLLDIHMPKISGFELYQKIKQAHLDIPVIFLTGDPSEETALKGLDLGAQDFIVKPISMNILKARIQNKIKLSTKNKDVIKINDFVLYVDIQQAQLNDQTISLTPIEFKLIHLLAQNPNKIFSRADISQKLWPNTAIQNQNLDTHLSNLRKKLKPFSQHIKTIKSRGYLLRV